MDKVESQYSFINTRALLPTMCLQTNELKTRTWPISKSMFTTVSEFVKSTKESFPRAATSVSIIIFSRRAKNYINTTWTRLSGSFTAKGTILRDINLCNNHFKSLANSRAICSTRNMQSFAEKITKLL